MELKKWRTANLIIIGGQSAYLVIARLPFEGFIKARYRLTAKQARDYWYTEEDERILSDALQFEIEGNAKMHQLFE